MVNGPDRCLLSREPPSSRHILARGRTKGNTMIEGIKLDFSSAELVSHVGERAAYHRQKETWYRQQVGTLEQGREENPNASNDPVSSLKRSQVEHAQKADLFEVIAKHVVPNEVYRLTSGDLASLEIISRYY